MSGPLILALDFGGTKLSAGLADADTVSPDKLTWLAHRRVITPIYADARYEYDRMMKLAWALLDGRTPAAIGISFGGPVDFERGLVRLSHHVEGWEEMRLRDRVSSRFDAPTVVDNDAAIAALGEHRFGAGRGYDDLMYLTVSTGVGGGWVLGGRPWRGHQGLAGEIGHIVVDSRGPVCLCGKRGCVERLASGPYMAQDATAYLRDHPDVVSPLRWPMDNNAGGLTGRDIAEAAAGGDQVARGILARGARAVGTGIGYAANLVNPQRFILGGGVARAGDLWWTAVRAAAREAALPEVEFDVVPALLGDDAPLWGAVALAQGILLSKNNAA